ncbi:hypothetical protein OG777_14560 [Micromonospora peucetia]|uniref:hypothetical protein n=1 Tax=Micromonospora peucetia TaxID=47871 RepID=UPI0022543CAA|nr:hypothetical protein [Micromonospora peucetia]MCX4388146.1 hypothetical protein [Micromonospora peucetia]
MIPSTPETATRAFFSFPKVTDAARHRAYNAWHQLDHRPENLALPGVVHGDRWVRTPACERLGSYPDLALAGSQYMAMYWFAEPTADSIPAWKDLGDRAIHQGRRPELAWTERPMTRMFRPVQGYVAPRALVTLAALPFRPNRGVHVEVSRVETSLHPDVADLSQFEHETQVPDLLARDGVAGVWTFRSAPSRSNPDGPVVRIRLTYLEADPVEFTRALAAGPLPAPPAALASTATPLLTGPLATITPWEWDWFDEPAVVATESVARA